MSGSLPHSIAISNHTHTSPSTPGYTTYDLRSDEDNNLAALNARNAKASSDLVVTISEQGQALSQRKQKKADDVETKREQELMLAMLDEEFDESDDAPTLVNKTKDSHINSYQEKTSTGDFLDQIV